jgi:hypothetical protein
MSDKSKLYAATGPLFASKSHAFCSSGRTSCEARSLKAPPPYALRASGDREATFSSKLYTATGPLFASKSHAFCSRGRTNREARSLKAPQAAFSP